MTTHNPFRSRVILLTMAVLVLLVGAAPAQAACVGDCDGNGTVGVDELIKAVNIAMGNMPLGQCSSADKDSNRSVTVDELLGAVGSSLNGCACAGGETFASTWEAIQKQVFARRGCVERVCHGSAPGQGGLDLSPGVAYRNLIEVPSTEVAMARVTPGDKTRSYLWAKLAAATNPDLLPDGFDIVGSPMPSGLEPLTEDELEAIDLWIYNGAPETGTVPGTEALLNACLPPPLPINIEPLDPPPPDQGIQVVMPQWRLPAKSEHEICFATYYDFSDVVPDDVKDPTGNYIYSSGFELRQDPQSHHLLLYYSPLNNQPGGIDVHHPSFGTWTCYGGDRAGQVCEPKDLGSCGTGICTSEIRPSFACAGYGPPSARPAEIIGGAGQAQAYLPLAPGVYARTAIRGVIYWNSHAFNLTDQDHVMHGWVNYFFARDRRFAAVQINDFSAIFKPNNDPYTRETFCNDHVFPIGARVFHLFAHMHSHGERFWVTDPDGDQIYFTNSFSDPTQQRYNPPLAFDDPDPARRTVRYCAIYNNGVNPDGTPNPERVTRLSRIPPGTLVGGTCTPKACVAGKIGAPCNGANDHATCDSAPGAGDGFCDACPITGGESTQNEMFVLFGAMYIDPTVPGARPPRN